MITHIIQKDTIPAHMNFGKFVLQQFMNTKMQNVCLEHYANGEKLTTLEFIQYAVNLSVGLTTLGVKRGDIVAVGAEKRITYQPTTLAVILTGATYTPLESQIGEAVLKHKLNLTKPNYFICSESFWKSYGDIIKGSSFIKTVVCFDDIDDVELSVSDLMSNHVETKSFEPAAVQGHLDVAVILYSSGTTGLPKGVQITHLSCIFNAIPYEFRNSCYKTAILFGEWYHSHDLFMGYKLISSGVKIVYTEDLTPETLLKIIQDKQVNLAIIVPSFVGYLAKEIHKYDLKSLTKIISVGYPLPSSYVEIINQRLSNVKEVVDDYGMTEVGIIASGAWGTKGPKAKSVGMAAPGIMLKIVDTKTRKRLGPYQRGEVCVRCPTLMKGYIGMDESAYLDSEGFLLTGDLGYYDEDQYLYIVDRLKDIINYDAEKFSPVELEMILQQHPGVEEAGAVGAPAGDLGELPAALVVRRPGCSLTEQELVDYVAQQASPYMQLRGGVRFVSGLPRNLRGKLLRRRLRQMLQDTLLN